MKTVHLLISGKVQGVFFRETSRRLATKLHINGWIKNTPDGKVEALVTGEKTDLNDFIIFCKTGPEKALVEEVKITNEKLTVFPRFEVNRSQ